ncbi:MAG: LacI family DNA-binding transcriptional regulator [Oscillospiraceae bacterium]
MNNNKSMKEIAKLAGVSSATVSRVINQNGRFSKETEARVLSVIKQYSYMPNISAKGLRTNRTPVMGILMPDITNPHFSSLVRNLEINFFENGYSCLICNTNESSELEKQHIQALSAQNVSGIVVISGTRDYPELRNIPIVYVDRPALDMLDEGIAIESDNEYGAYLATKELIRAGARNITILKCIGNDGNQLNRYKGCQRALNEAGFSEDMWLAIDLPEVTLAAGFEVVDRLLQQKIPFDGLMCTTDTIAAGCVIALRERGIQVPGDVLVTGFDDSVLAQACGCGLTSVRQDVSAMAHLATELLLDVIHGKKPKKTYYSLPVSLTIRASTRPFKLG